MKHFGKAFTFAACMLGACAPKPDFKGSFEEPVLLSFQQTGPAGAPAGTCWGRDEIPATIETVTKTVEVTPEERGEDGSLITPAVYKSVEEQTIIYARDDIWFETPCADAIDNDFIAALQRALTARGLMEGDATGVMDNRTADAVRAYQKPQGLNSGQLSLVAAQKLGLVAYSREEIDQF
ncbi:MAG: peptidoglycan-binding domain-containing protein [Planktomarina sp.]